MEHKNAYKNSADTKIVLILQVWKLAKKFLESRTRRLIKQLVRNKPTKAPVETLFHKTINGETHANVYDTKLLAWGNQETL